MSGEFRLVAITLPGFADVPRDWRLQTLSDYAQWVGQQVLATARPRIILGHGIGGSITLELMQQFAAEIDGVILHAPVGARLDTRWFPTLFRVPGSKSLAQWALSSRICRPVMRRLLFSRHIPADDLERFFEDYRVCQVFGQMIDLITPHWFHSLHPTSLPSALVWGARERTLKLDQIDHFRTLLPYSVVRIVPDWDYFPMIEQPQAYAHEISRLARLMIDGH